MAREALLHDPAAHIAAQTSEVLLLCQAGVRSAQCAHALAALGYRNVSSVQGGPQAWAAAGLPMRKPDIDADFGERYSRHLRLPEVGLAGQQTLEAARVLLVGCLLYTSRCV